MRNTSAVSQLELEYSARACSEIVLLIRAANPMNAVNRLFVAYMAAKCVAGIRRVRDKATIADDFHDSLHPARLRVCRMNFDEFRHARIVGEPRLRA